MAESCPLGWDKAADIRFKKPGRSTLYARFRLEDREVEHIRAALERRQSLDRTYHVDLVAAHGVVPASVEKKNYIR